MPDKKCDYRDLIFGIDAELNKVQDADILLERILSEARRVVNAEAGTTGLYVTAEGGAGSVVNVDTVNPDNSFVYPPPGGEFSGLPFEFVNAI